MTDSKSIWKFLKKLFTRRKKKITELHYKPSISLEFEEDDSDLEGISKLPTSLKRHQTCSFDLSDKTLRLINTEQLTNIDCTSNIYRTSSFNLDRDFPKKLLSITDFEEKEIVGEGAFGRAIKVEHLKSGSFFVLKEVLSHSKENEESFIREVSLLRSLKHPNVLTTLGLVLKDKSICLLTELMHGGSLQSRIMNINEEISIKQKVLFLRDIAAGMNFLHQHSIMHRDLTSSNCLLRKNNTVVVSDFGLSKFLNNDVADMKHFDYVRSLSSEIINTNKEQNECSNLEMKPKNRIRNFLSVGDMSEFGEIESKSEEDSINNIMANTRRKCRNIRRKHTVVGSAFWMAPEMLAGKNYNYIVDLYSFGIIGCEVTARVSAHPDFLERNNKDMSVNFNVFIKKHKNDELRNCPDELLTFIGKCCETNPDLRPTFDTLLSWIEDILFRITNNVPHKIRTYNVPDCD